MIDEEKLLQDLKKKKRSSIEEAVRRYTPYVSVVIYNTIGGSVQKEDIEEVISDSFLALWQNSERLTMEKGGIRAYLGTIARNAARNKLRETAPAGEELYEDIVSDAADPGEQIEQKEEKLFLLDMICMLGEPDSEIFLRYYYYDEKIRTIANVTGMPASTVKSRLFRGKAKLKKLIEQNRRDGNE